MELTIVHSARISLVRSKVRRPKVTIFCIALQGFSQMIDERDNHTVQLIGALISLSRSRAASNVYGCCVLSMWYLCSVLCLYSTHVHESLVGNYDTQSLRE